ncbi:MULTISPECIES: hypothetical protein [Mammaliicoccus]|uniref:hypothetical protein n=1 Tax=Mammaliicoccus TaxID=2803850 RepID=UPI000D1CA728|nr:MULTISPECIES: hypothetical protein [Mammaliicoccus]MEB7805977.1 hypothetical protein [Mammaliicoccus fleurettii]PTE33027.1 hypothetical protein BUY94_08585 [Mammaliicoccus fleurettii]
MVEMAKKIIRTLIFLLSGLLLTRFVIQQLNQFTDMHLSWFYLDQMPYSFVVVISLFFICLVINSTFSKEE